MKSLSVKLSLAIFLLNLFCLFYTNDAYVVYKKTRILPPMFASLTKRMIEFENGLQESDNNNNEFDNGAASDAFFGGGGGRGYEKRYNPYPLPPFLMGRNRAKLQRSARGGPSSLPIMKREHGDYAGHYD